jgi:hypothetical protein
MSEEEEKQATEQPAAITATNTRDFWKEEEESLLRQWADKAQCYQWMHMRSHTIYTRKNALYTIPVIIISTITGTANFAQERFSEEQKPYVAMTIGSLSIIAGIISTVSQFLKISELNESHRVASLSWGKFYRNIKTELSRHPLDRSTPKEFIKYSQEEYDRLVEISPFMPKRVMEMFNMKFKKNLDLTKPEVCDVLSATQVFELSDDERRRIAREFEAVEEAIEDVVQESSEVLAKKAKFAETFFEINGRQPTEDEISKLFKSDSSNNNSEMDDILGGSAAADSFV